MDLNIGRMPHGPRNSIADVAGVRVGHYYDTLIDDCHVFSFGLDLTKLFSDVDAETAAETKLYDSVKFKIQNKTDGTWIIAKRNDAEGVYYVTGHTDQEADATVFTPVTMGKSCGHIMVKGLEEDTYTITETQTANGYTLLKNAITVTISLKENTANTCNVYTKDVLGVLQNDPHYSFDGGEDLKLANIPQRALSHRHSHDVRRSRCYCSDRQKEKWPVSIWHPGRTLRGAFRKEEILSETSEEKSSPFPWQLCFSCWRWG